MVEQEAVNFEVTGSSPVAGAKIDFIIVEGFYGNESKIQTDK